MGPEGGMEYYIVRVYRREPDGVEELTGIVEDVVRKVRTPFKDPEGLWRALHDQAQAGIPARENEDETGRDDAG